MMRGPYPTIEEVQCADLDELTVWDQTLRPPQADAEHAALRRIKRRLVELRAEKRAEGSTFVEFADFAEAWKQIFGQSRK